MQIQKTPFLDLLNVSTKRVKWRKFLQQFQPSNIKEYPNGFGFYEFFALGFEISSTHFVIDSITFYGDAACQYFPRLSSFQGTLPLDIHFGEPHSKIVATFGNPELEMHLARPDVITGQRPLTAEKPNLSAHFKISDYRVIFYFDDSTERALFAVQFQPWQ